MSNDDIILTLVGDNKEPAPEIVVKEEKIFSSKSTEIISQIWNLLMVVENFTIH